MLRYIHIMNLQRPRKLSSAVWLILSCVCLLAVPSSSSVLLALDDADQARESAVWNTPPSNCSVPVDEEWVVEASQIRWVAYSSPNPNPDKGFYRPTAEIVYKDLVALKKAKFTGLVTYGSPGIMGKEFLTIAQSLGYRGVIMGIWDPNNAAELKNAKNASSLPIVMGYSIGNEGFERERSRYTVSNLCSAINDLRSGTGKPVTTSEDIDDYYIHPELLSVGDWIFPIVHPYWHFAKYPVAAVQWEQDQYRNLVEQTDRFVLFKEVGLPTAGAYGLSETSHDRYYRGLARTNVRFVYFEGFDQPSKTTSSVEPYWGIFHSTRKPKLLGWNLMGYRLFTSNGAYDGWVLECSEKSGKGCSVDNAGTTLLVGDDAENQQYRAFLSFNTAGLPDNAVITSVKLKVRSAGVVGGNPLDKRRRLKVDLCLPFFGNSLELQTTDFQSGTNCNGAGIFENKPGNGWYIAELTPTIFSHINLKGITQFRLRFNVDDNNDLGADYIKFYSGNASDSYKPILLVRYSIP